jgi:hypothetical protein
LNRAVTAVGLAAKLWLGGLDKPTQVPE